MFSVKVFVFLIVMYIATSAVLAHGPPRERDNEDIAIGRKVKKSKSDPSKMAAKWCSMAKVCNHDRVPVCGVNHAGDIMGFKDLCDMFDFNCLRKRNFKQTGCPADSSMLTVSRRPSTSYYED